MENKENNIESTHHLVSPTANLVAYMRAHSGIPFSEEISKLTDSENITRELLGDLDIEWWMGSTLELRYKSLSALIEKEALAKGVKNIFELASGVLPRGLIMTEDESVNYLETDLPDMIESKKSLVQDLDVDMKNRHIDFQSLNALDGERMKELASQLPEGPICIINEGLLMYLTVEEKGIVAKNILNILKERGGLWITPDLSNSERMKEMLKLKPEIGALIQKIGASTQRDMRANSIGTHDEVIAFFENIGFTIEEYEQNERIDSLSVFNKVPPLDSEKLDLVRRFVGMAKVWVLRPKVEGDSELVGL